VSVLDNVDRRLQAHWESCRAHRDEARRLLPRAWVGDGRAPADHLGDLFDDVLERARERIVSERAALERREHLRDLDPAG
jgi:hypothetical protein